MGDTNELMEFLSASLGATLDEIYQRLIDCDFTREDPGLAMFVVALLNALGREGRGNRPTEVVLMLAFGESGTAERGRNRLMRWRRGEMSGHDLAREPGLGEQRDHRLGEMPLPVQPAQPLIGAKIQRDGPGSSHSVDSPTAAPPPKRVRVNEIEIQTSETIETLEKRERYQSELEGKTGATLSRVNFMDVIRRYGTQSIMKVGLNQPIMREVLEKIVNSMESDVLTESVTEDSANDQQVTKKLPVRRARKGLKRLKEKTGSRAVNPRVVKSKASAFVASLTSAGHSGESGQGDGATLTGGEK